jgi:hypothetical protein
MKHDGVEEVSVRQISGRAPRSLLPLGVVVGAFVLYACSLSRHYSEGEDSAQYVLDVTAPSSAGDLFHPNHLAFNALNRCVYVPCRDLGYGGDASLTMKLVNVLAGALALGAMLTILRRVKVDDRLALCWVACTAVTFGYWSYSTQPETYVLPLPPILLCVHLLLGLAEGGFRYRTFAALGLLGAVATLLHQQHVLVLSATAIAAAIIGYRSRSEVPMGRIVTGLGIFGAVAAAIVGGAYLSVSIGVLHLRDPAAIIAWAKGHARGGLWTPWSFSAPIQSVLAGFSRAVFGGHFLYKFDWFYEPIARRFPNKILTEERFLAQHLPPWVSATCLVATLVALASVPAVIGTLAFPTGAEPLGREPRRRCQALDAIVALLIVHYYVFNTLWEPTNVEFWIALLPVVAIGICSLQARRPGAIRWWPAVAVLASSLLVANGLGSILPQADPSTDYWYQANLYLIRNARAGDVIVTDGGFIPDLYLRLYTGADVVSAGYHVGRLPAILSDGDSRRVWITSWALDPPREAYLTRAFKASDSEAARLCLEKVRGRMVRRDEGPYQTVWELAPEAP